MSKVNVHTETMDLNWKLVNLINETDRFDASWQAVERREGTADIPYLTAQLSGSLFGSTDI